MSLQSTPADITAVGQVVILTLQIKTCKIPANDSPVKIYFVETKSIVNTS